MIEQVEEIMLLGVIVEGKLSWNSRVHYILQKMGRSMDTKHCRKCIPRWLTKQLVQSLVLSHLGYASVVWSNTSENNSELNGTNYFGLPIQNQCNDYA